MRKITNVADLNSAIQRLEYLQDTDWTLLKKQFHITAESLRPVNVIKSTFMEMVSAASSRTKLANTAIGLVTGVVAKKMIVGRSKNPITKVFGLIVEMLVANKVSKNVSGIGMMGTAIIGKILNNHSAAEKR